MVKSNRSLFDKLYEVNPTANLKLLYEALILKLISATSLKV